MSRLPRRLLAGAVVGAAVLLPAVPAVAAPTAGPIGPGDTGSAVRCWQGQLGWYAGRYAAARRLPRPQRDGVFGPRTEEATRAFQLLVLVPLTGRADDITQRRMRFAEELAVRKTADRVARRLLARCSPSR